jgi:hypothetical protein
MDTNIIYSADDNSRQDLGFFAEQKCWTAWRTEERANQNGKVAFIEKRIASPANVPERRALPHQACSR